MSMKYVQNNDSPLAVRFEENLVLLPKYVTIYYPQNLTIKRLYYFSNEKYKL